MVRNVWSLVFKGLYLTNSYTDMYSRKTNKFVAFNSAGVKGWQGMHAVTKLFSADDILDTLTEPA